MSQKPADNVKRRPPADKPPDDHQDADWGFDADAADPALEKKLGMALVVCLLAGFSFVLFQKYHLLRDAKSQAAALSSAASTADGETPAELPFLEASLESLAATTADQPTEAPDSTVDSPFYSPADEPTPTPAIEESWTLTQAEMPPPAPTPAAADAPPAEEPQGEAFDPFASVSSPAPAPAPEEAAPPSSIVWEDPPAAMERSTPAGETLSRPGAPAPLPLGSADAAGETFTRNSTRLENSAPSLDASPQPTAEPELLVFGDLSGDEGASSADSPPPQGEPEPEPQTEPEPEPDPFSFGEPAVAASQPPVEPAVPVEPAFDPFSSAGSETPTSVTSPAATLPAMPLPSDPQPLQSPPSDPPPAAEDPFPFLAPPSRAAPPEPLPTPGGVTEPPAWPFSESAGRAERMPQPPASLPGSEPPRLRLDVGDSQPAGHGSEPVPLNSLPGEVPIAATASQPLGTFAPSAQAVIGEVEIVVTDSDSFWSIAQREYGSARYFTALARYNVDRVPQPETLRAGTKLKIPPPELLESRFPELFLRSSRAATGAITPMSGTSHSESAPPAGLFVDRTLRPHYRVGERDTLSSIAQQHLGRAARWTEVYELNRDQLTSPSTLRIGMVLKLPADASGVSIAPAGGFSR